MESRTTLAGSCISCAGSHLSTPAGVVGLFTFAYASCSAFTSTRNGGRERWKRAPKR